MPSPNDAVMLRARHLAKVGSPRKASSENAGFVRSLGENELGAHKSPDVPLGFSAAAPSDRREAIAALAAPLIKRFEGYREHAYQDSAGVWTVGYGTTRIGGQPISPSVSVSPWEAEEYLKNDMAWAVETALMIESKAPDKRLTEAQCAALTSWIYNVGAAAALKSTAVTGRIKAGDLHGAADGLLLWNKAGGKVLRGLTRRREAERSLFLSEHVETPEPPDASRAAPDAPEKPLAKSTSIWAGLTGIGAWALDLVEQKFALFSKLTGLPGAAGAVLSVVAISAIVWMIAERVRKARVGGEVGG